MAPPGTEKYTVVERSESRAMLPQARFASDASQRMRTAQFFLKSALKLSEMFNIYIENSDIYNAIESGHLETKPRSQRCFADGEKAVITVVSKQSF